VVRGRYDRVALGTNIIYKTSPHLITILQLSPAIRKGTTNIRGYMRTSSSDVEPQLDENVACWAWRIVIGVCDLDTDHGLERSRYERKLYKHYSSSRFVRPLRRASINTVPSSRNSYTVRNTQLGCATSSHGILNSSVANRHITTGDSHQNKIKVHLPLF
jgi:hypothetical protein